MDLSRITKTGVDFFMNLTLNELFETAEEIAEEVKNHGGKKK